VEYAPVMAPMPLIEMSPQPLMMVCMTDALARKLEIDAYLSMYGSTWMSPDVGDSVRRPCACF
jgi:hypothetical protein